jgi:hypothetical protein
MKTSAAKNANFGNRKSGKIVRYRTANLRILTEQLGRIDIMYMFQPGALERHVGKVQVINGWPGP